MSDLSSSKQEMTWWEKCGYNAGIFIGSVGVLLLITALIAIGASINGLAIMVMWGWFVAPLGLAKLSLAHAIGLGLLVKYLISTHEQQTSKVDDLEDRVRHAIVYACIYPFAVLGLAWICHTFM